MCAQVLSKDNPAEVIRRYESKQYATNEACYKHYVAVCVRVSLCVLLDIDIFACVARYFLCVL